MLDELIDTYQQLQDLDKTLCAASRLLQLDAKNMKALFISVFIKKGQCAKSVDATGKSKTRRHATTLQRMAQTGLRRDETRCDCCR